MKFGRAMAFVGVAWLLMLVRAPLAPILPWPAISTEISLLVVLYLGFFGRGSMTASVGVALAIGYLTDLHSGSPRGLHALTLALVMVVARGASNRLLVGSVWQQLVVTLGASLAHGALVVALSTTNYEDDASAALMVVPQVALLTCAVAPLLFAMLRRLDRKLQPDPRMRLT